MAKFSIYNIKLLGLSQGKHTFEYDLDNKFFHDIDGDEVKKGNAVANVEVVATSSTYNFSFDIKGNVKVPCNRCLDEMDHPIDAQNRLVVKLGAEYSEESDEVVIIPLDEGEINIAWFLYEFIILNIPIKHSHEAGKCNRFMSNKLRKHESVSKHDEDELENDYDSIDENIEDESDNIDPRWSGLKGLSFEDN